MHQVLLIAGTRPEAIKLAPVLLALRRSQSLRPLLCSTGQHKEMLRQAWQAFGLQPDIDMHTMTNAQTLAGLSARLFAAIDAELEANRPDFLLVQGAPISRTLRSRILKHSFLHRKGFCRWMKQLRSVEIGRTASARTI